MYMESKKRTILLVITCSMALVVVILFGMDVLSEKKLDLQKVYVARCDIKPRTCIQEEDVLEIEVPHSYLLDYVVVEKDDIVGKYTSIQGMIPAGSLFYESMLYDRSSLPDYPECELRKNQAAYTLEVDLAKLGGTLVANQRVDLYVTLKKDKENHVSDCLFEDVRIIAIKDHQGIDLEDQNSSKTPYLAILAIDREDIKYLAKADEMGSIRLFSTDKTYDTKGEATLRKDTELFLRLSENA